MKKRMPPDDNAFVEHGGYMAVKINKLEDQFATLQQHLLKTKIFEGKKMARTCEIQIIN
jgi:hypothetical protein